MKSEKSNHATHRRVIPPFDITSNRDTTERLLQRSIFFEKNSPISLFSSLDTVRMVIIIPTGVELSKHHVVSAPTDLQ